MVNFTSSVIRKDSVYTNVYIRYSIKIIAYMQSLNKGAHKHNL